MSDNTPLILIVDDETDFLESLAAALDIHGCNVVTAASEEKALDIIDTTAPDGVVADLNLCGRDSVEGVRIINAARSRSETCTTLLISACAPETVEQAAGECDADAWLEKPVTIADILRNLGLDDLVRLD